MAAHPRRLSIEEMQRIAAERGGRCLSETYVNTGTPLEWECAEGHRWTANANNIKRGSWCPVCARPRQGGNAYSVTVDLLREIARSHGGECLEDEYLGAFTKHRWRCAEGHVWEAISDSVRRGSWCPICNARAQRLGIKGARQLAETRGWKCLSDRYESNQTKLVAPRN